jgi:GntR family transcriptional repressor for pyruvate dehydrogenase complex
MSSLEISAAPLERPRLSDGVYSHLLSGIIEGRFPVGARLPPENQLAQQFGVSRPVIREALHRLQSDGVVLSRQGAGSYVQRSPSGKVAELTKDISLNRALQSFEVRLSLEVLSARLAARNRSEEQMNDIRLAAGAMHAAMEGRGIPLEADYAFHHAIAAASGNALLLEAFEILAPNFKGGMNVTLSLTNDATRARRERVLDEHDRIVHAIQVSDGESAAIAMSYHLDQARNRLLDGKLDR